MAPPDIKPGASSATIQTSANLTVGLGLQLPVFVYEKTTEFFKQFKRFARLSKLNSDDVLDHVCYALDAASGSQWLADLVEASVQTGNRPCACSGRAADAVVGGHTGPIARVRCRE